MTHHLGRPPPRRWLVAIVITVLGALLSSCGAGDTGPRLTVMTRNLYLGTGLTNVFASTSFGPLVAAASQDWATVLATDLPTRAAALAGEIARVRPDVVGLQEVTLWRDQTPGDFLGHPGPNATHVVFDFLAILRGALAARGIPYRAVATSTNADVELPRAGRVDVRATDRDVLLVRADRAERFSNPRHGHYAAVLPLPVLSGTVPNTRGWATVDYRPGGHTAVRIFTTHLEVGDRGAGAAQQQQAGEALAIIAASPYPVIALGDFNSPADGSTTDTYGRLTSVLDDAWAAARPADPGPTCCQTERLTNADPREQVRLDLVLTPRRWPVDRVVRTGDRPFRDSPPPLWASDHCGVTARIAIRG